MKSESRKLKKEIQVIVIQGKVDTVQTVAITICWRLFVVGYERFVFPTTECVALGVKLGLRNMEQST